jgi:hypothetical protein
MFYCPTNRYFSQTVPETPGLKSSLNQVHLRIHHALKETSYLTDGRRLARSDRIATTICNYFQEEILWGKLLLVIHHELPMLTSMSLISWYQHLFSHKPDPSNLKATQTAAAEGNAEAQFALGLKYCSERGAVWDPEQAVRWYRKAADQDHAPAQFNLAMMFASGEGVPRDDAAALTWTRRAAEGGAAGAQYRLGSRYHRNSMDRLQMDEVESRIEAYKWFHLAAAQGYQGAVAACERVTLRMSREEVADGNQRVAAFVVRKPAHPLATSSSMLLE